MKLAGIFRDLEELYNFQTIGHGGHLLFYKEAKILHRHVFITINILCNFGEDIFINECYVKVYVKTGQTDACTNRRTYGRHFIISLPRPLLVMIYLYILKPLHQ